MLAIYGQKFASLFPGEASAREWRETWAIALSDMSGEQIAAGIEKLMKGASEWPPTTGEFRALCKPVIRPEYQRDPALAAPRDTKDRSKELAAIREMLARKMTSGGQRSENRDGG